MVLRYKPLSFTLLEVDSTRMDLRAHDGTTTRRSKLEAVSRETSQLLNLADTASLPTTGVLQISLAVLAREPLECARVASATTHTQRSYEPIASAALEWSAVVP